MLAIRTSVSNTSTFMRAVRRSSALSVRGPERLSDKMSRIAARFTQADVARSIRAAKQAGAGTVELLPDGRIRILLDGEEKPTPPVEPDREVVL
jgi:hypothetical protein